MAFRVGLNGFGRTGRSFLRAVIERERPVQIVAINDLVGAEDLARLLARDSVHGPFTGVEAEGDRLLVREQEILVLHEPDPKALPWDELGITVAVEAAGRFTAVGQGRRSPRRGRNPCRGVRPEQRRRCHLCDRRQRSRFRSFSPLRGVQCLLYDELPGPDGQSPR